MAADIRPSLPLVSKSGTSHKPVWTLGEKRLRFIAPLNKAGVGADGNKPRLGKRILGKYVASKTAKGGDLLFVGLFAEVKVKAAS